MTRFHAMQVARAAAAAIALTAAAIVTSCDDAHAGSVLGVLQSWNGLHEGKHNRQLRKILGVNPRAVQWCGYGMAAAYRAAGKAKRIPRGFASHNSWRNAGKRVPKAAIRKGDLFAPGRHVTMFSHKKNGRYCGYGGNQSNRFQLSCYKPSSIKWVVRP